MRVAYATAGMALLSLLAACSNKPTNLPDGPQAYQSFPPPRPDGQLPQYRIGAFDKIAVSVYQEDDLSVKDVQVDAGGNVLLPLIGQVYARGRTAIELAADIGKRLGQRFLVNPQVSVIVETSVSQKVTIEGSVTDPGVYPIQGRTTLLDAVALAHGTTRVAAFDNIVVFREVSGQRMGAVFNLKQIQKGEAADPELLGNDTVVVGLSNVKAAWRDALTAAPLVNIFRAF